MLKCLYFKRMLNWNYVSHIFFWKLFLFFFGVLDFGSVSGDIFLFKVWSRFVLFILPIYQNWNINLKVIKYFKNENRVW